MENDKKFVYIPLERKLIVTNLISLFHHKYPKHYTFEGEKHDFWELIYVDQGTLEITSDDRHITLRTGEIAFHKPGEFHSVRTYDSLASAIICSFTCEHSSMDLFKNYIAPLHTKERTLLYEMLYMRSRIFFNDSVPFHSTPRTKDSIPFMYLQTVQSYLELILLTILIRNKANFPESALNDTELKLGAYHSLTQNVIIYMKQNLDRKLTLQQIADTVGYSVSSMKRLFNRDMNQGVMDYFIKLKIDEAKRLMNDADATLSLTQISAGLGFNDLAYFCRKFKQYEGIRPSEFRRNCRIELLKKN